MYNKIRIRLEYTRQKRVTETGYVMVDVDPDATLADVYELAYKKQFAERLAKDNHVLDEDWDFHIKQGQEYEPPQPPTVA